MSMTNQELQALVISQAAEIKTLKEELARLNVNKVRPWREVVIELKKANPKMTQKQLAEEVGKALVTVKKFMQQPETKALLAEV